MSDGDKEVDYLDEDNQENDNDNEIDNKSDNSNDNKEEINDDWDPDGSLEEIKDDWDPDGPIEEIKEDWDPDGPIEEIKEDWDPDGDYEDKDRDSDLEVEFPNQESQIISTEAVENKGKGQSSLVFQVKESKKEPEESQEEQSQEEQSQEYSGENGQEIEGELKTVSKTEQMANLELNYQVNKMHERQELTKHLEREEKEQEEPPSKEEIEELYNGKEGEYEIELEFEFEIVAKESSQELGQDSKQKGHQKYNVKDLETEGKGPSQEEIKEVEENALQEDVDEIFRESEEREEISKLDQEIMSDSQNKTHEGKLQDISQLKEEMEALYNQEKAQQEIREKNQEIKQDLIEKTQNNSKKKERLKGKRFELIYNDKVLANYNPNQTFQVPKGDLSQQTKVKTKTKTKGKKKETSKQKSFKTTAKKMESARDYGNREETKENVKSHSTQTQKEKYREETRKLIQKARQEVSRRAEIKKEIENQEKQEQSEVSQENLKEINQEDSKDIKKEKNDSKKELYERYNQETRGRAIYGKHETKGYREWEQKLDEQQDEQEEELNKTQEIPNENKEMAEHHQKEEISEKNQEQQKEQRETIRRFHEEWANYLAKSIRESKDNEISEENKEELIEVLSKYDELQNLVKKLKKREINKTVAEKELGKLEKTFSENGSIEIELFKNFRWFQGFYQKNGSESLLKQEEKKYLRYISKRLEELKNVEETKWLNWKELLKANLYQITMLSFKEKSQIINMLQKKELSKEDKKELITKLIRLKIEDLNKLFGKSFEAYAKNYVKWGTGWYEDPGLKRVVLTNYFSIKKKSKPNYSIYYDHFVGLFAHSALIKIITKELIERRLKYYREPWLYRPILNNRPDGLIIKNNKSNYIFEKLSEKLGFSKEKIKNIKYLLIDFTGNLSKANLIEKIIKYNPNKNTILLIIGLNWKIKRQIRNLPVDDLLFQKNLNNIRIISHKLLKDILDITKYSRYWDETIRYVEANDLNSLKTLSKDPKIETNLYGLYDLEKIFGTRDLYEYFRNEIDKKIDRLDKIPEIKLDFIFTKNMLNNDEISEFHNLFKKDIKKFKELHSKTKILTANKISNIFKKYFKKNYNIPDNFNYLEATKKDISYFIDLIEKFAAQLKIKGEIKNLAKKLIEKLYKQKIIKKNRKDKGYIAVSLFLAAKALNDYDSQERIFKHVYLHNSTLRNRLNDFEILRTYLLKIQINDLVKKYCKALSISKISMAISKNLIRLALRQKIVEDNDYIPHIVASMLYLTSKALNKPITLKMFADKFNLDRYSLSQVKTKFQNFNLLLKKIELNVLIEKYGIKLDASEKIIMFVKNLIKKALDRKLIRNGYPQHIVAAAFYIAFDTLNKPFTKQEIGNRLSIKYDYITKKLSVFEFIKFLIEKLKINNIIIDYGARLGVSKKCISFTKRLIKKAIKKSIFTPSDDIRYYIAAAYNLTSRVHNEPKSILFISRKLSFTRGALESRKKSFNSFLNKLKNYEIQNLINSIARKLKVSSDCKYLTKFLINEVRKNQKIKEKENLKHLIAAAFYLASRTLNEAMTQTKIAKKLSIGQNDISSKIEIFEFLKRKLKNIEFRKILKYFAKKLEVSHRCYILTNYFIRKARKSQNLDKEKSITYSIAAMYYLTLKALNQSKSIEEIANKTMINEKTIRNKKEAFNRYKDELRNIRFFTCILEFGKKLELKKEKINEVLELVKKFKNHGAFNDNNYIPHIVATFYYLLSQKTNKPLTLRYIREKTGVDGRFIIDNRELFNM